MVPSWLLPNVSPKTRAIVAMALASSTHYAGYELARSGTMALFTSQRTGFSGASAAPLCTACVSPFSFLLLWSYTRSLECRGPRKSLQYSTLLFAMILAFSSLLLRSLEDHLDQHEICRQLARVTTFLLNICLLGFVQLLYTQHWSFLNSICSQEGSVWFAPIAGFGSLASTVAAMSVSPLIDRIGLTGLLLASSAFLLWSSMFADDAYRIAELNNFEPGELNKAMHNNSTTDSVGDNPKSNSSKGQPEQKQHHQHHQSSLIQTANSLFARVPILGYLCTEVLLCECVSSMLSFLLVIKVKEFIPNDEERARWTGTCYAVINGLSGFLQFAVLPFVVKRENIRRMWLLMPCIMLMCASFMSYQSQTTLQIIAVTFTLFKALEYSVREYTQEMVYVSLDYESRFIGKEIIGLFVNRAGKSTMAVGLSLVTNFVGSSSSGLDQMFVQALSVSSLFWLLASYPLAHGKEKTQ